MGFKPGDIKYKAAFAALAMALAACTASPPYQPATPDETFVQEVQAQDREATDLSSDALEEDFNPDGDRLQ